MTRNGLSLLVLSVVAITLGCSSENIDKQPSKESKTDKSTSQTFESSPRVLTKAEQTLAGVWLGKAFLEDKLVEAEFEARPNDEEKMAFVDEAELFLTTMVAVHFKNDGTFEQDIEQAATGMRQMGQGTWRVRDQQGDKLIVETVEVDAEGKEITTERLFQLYPDQNGFAMPAPVVESLTSCNPLLIFSRQQDFTDDRTAETPAEELKR